MTSNYLPPHLRNKEPAASELGGPEQVTNFSAAWAETSQERHNDNLYTVREIHVHFWGKEAAYEDTHSATLHASKGNPDTLSWMLLFNGANPKWQENGVIFVKSNLDLLPAIKEPSLSTANPDNSAKTQLAGQEATGEAGEKNENTPAAKQTTTSQLNEGFPVDHFPVAIFTQSTRHADRSFKFDGWYKVNRLQLLEPGSEELVRMLNKKWEKIDRYGKVVPRRRDPSKWQESMSYRWAVIKMEKDEKVTKEKEGLDIEKIDEQGENGLGSRKKSVNEMLNEMRRGNESKDA